MNIHCIIQARMGSTRLPGKIMKFIEDKVVLQHVVDRCKMSKNIDKVIVATTNKKDDDIIEKYCIDNNILYYRGDENNVLERYYLTATTFNSDIIIRVTSDCPLIDYNIIDNISPKVMVIVVENADPQKIKLLMSEDLSPNSKLDINNFNISICIFNPVISNWFPLIFVQSSSIYLFTIE